MIPKFLKYFIAYYFPFYLFFLLLFSIVFLLNQQAIIIALVFIAWIANVYIYKLNYSTTIVIALVFLILAPVGILANQTKFAEISAMWSYLFFLLGTIQMMLDSVVGKRYNVGYDNFFRRIWHSMDIKYK